MFVVKYRLNTYKDCTFYLFTMVVQTQTEETGCIVLHDPKTATCVIVTDYDMVAGFWDNSTKITGSVSPNITLKPTNPFEDSRPFVPNSHPFGSDEVLAHLENLDEYTGIVAYDTSQNIALLTNGKGRIKAKNIPIPSHQIPRRSLLPNTVKLVVNPL